MNHRHSSVNTSNSLLTKKKLSTEDNKRALRPSSEIRKAFQGLEAQKKNVKTPLEKFQLATKKPLQTSLTSSDIIKQSTTPKLVQSSSVSRKLESKPSLKSPSRFTQRLLVCKQQGVLLSQEEIKQLTSKFEALSATIVRLATSNCPMSVRSLESLLTKEVTDCLGSAINSAKFTEGFVRETRRLLSGLNCKFEEGKVSPQLIKGHKGGHRPFVRANSATTACYRDRYLKELVMDVLQDMCSGVEVDQVSKHRAGGVVRDLVRAEAGIEPEVFQRVEREIEELQKCASHGQREVRSASRMLDQLISDHQMRQEDVASAELVKDNQKPVYAVEQDSDGKVLTKEKVLGDKNNCCSKDSLSKNQSDLAKNCAGVGDDHQPPEPHKSKDPELLASDPIGSIRPRIDQIVQEEISRAQERTEAVLNRMNEGSLVDSRDCSVDSIVSEGVTYDDTDDEIEAEETLLFLEALKADATHNMVNECTVSSNCSMLEASEEVFEEDVETKGVPHFHDEVSSVKRIVNPPEECKFCNKDKTLEPTKEDSLTWLESEVLSYKLYQDNSMPTIAEETSDDVCFGANESNENVLRDVKSVWWSQESKEAEQIIQKLKTALNSFDQLENKSEQEPINDKESEVPLDSSVKNITESYMGGHDFTVQEMAHILKNISKKLCQLPICNENNSSYNYDTYFPLTDSQQTELVSILSLMVNALDGSISTDNDSSDLTKGFQFDGENKFTGTKEKVSGTFNMISETLSRAPAELRKQPISVFAPPESLMKTLALLAASGLFRDCFISAILEVHKSKEDIIVLNSNMREMDGKSFGNEGDLGKLCSRPGKDVEVVRPVSFETQKSSGEIFQGHACPGVKSFNHENTLNLAFKRFEMKIRNCDDVHKNTFKYENYLGLSTAGMTVKNVSDMFVFLSAVLNDIPDRVKSEKLSSLNPPSTLLAALDILYNAEDGGCFTEAQKSASFNSLTVQSVSDLFLTLSKTFADLPERVKHSNVLDLDPPRSLLHAVNLLTSLSSQSVLDGRSDEGDCRNDESQEYFYDALDTSSSPKCEPNSGANRL